MKIASCVFIMLAKAKIVVLLISLSFVIILGFILLLVYVVSMHQKSRSQYLIDMEELKVNFKNEILKSQLEMQEQTFAEISMEIHDNISQILSVSKLNLATIENASPEIIATVKYSIGLMTHAMNDLRDLSRRLDSDRIKREGLVTAIEEYVSQLRKSVQREFFFHHEGDIQMLPIEKALILFRILQEAVNNVLKHTDASRIEISLTYSASQLRLEVTDNGKGFQMEEVIGRLHEGSGLKNMQKRTAMIQGAFELVSSLDLEAGTRVRVTMPIHSPVAGT